MNRISTVPALIMLIAVFARSTPLHAEELLGDPGAGRQLAEDVCSTCHVVASGQEAANDIEAPAFPELAREPGITAISLRVFLQTPHDRMPDLMLDRDETDDIVAYILSLKP
ncbi:MAG: c-type cytochrome [Geminicoccaceae bacterium]